MLFNLNSINLNFINPINWIQQIYKSKPILASIIIVFAFLYYQYAFGYIGSRTWPVPIITPFVKTILFQSDVVMNGDNQFLIGDIEDTSFPVVQGIQDDKVKQEAVQFFKNQYGLSEFYLNFAMRKVYVNDDAKYTASFIEQQGKTNYHIQDGGYVVYLPPGKRLYGRYGGVLGVTNRKSSIIPYGYYKFSDYLVRYFAICPMAWTETYDGRYTLIDCDVEIVNAPDKGLLGLKGKAQGMQKKFKLVNGKHHVVIRNVLTFSESAPSESAPSEST